MSEQFFKARVAALLREIEWGGEYGCVECGSGLINEKHASDCELAALLKECETPPQPVRKCLCCGETAEVYAIELPRDPRDVTRRYEEWCRKCIGHY